VLNFLNMLGGSRLGRGRVSPALLAVLGVLAYRSLKGKGRLADLVGPSAAGGLTGGALVGGLNDLLRTFRRNGPSSSVADSWVSSGPNKPVSPEELERTLGAERIQWLMAQTGMSKDDLLAGLASSLPEAIDKLTPDGRIPTEEELATFREGEPPGGATPRLS
jgi:uncharacterized protein YidB (DUF937 family)